MIELVVLVIAGAWLMTWSDALGESWEWSKRQKDTLFVIGAALFVFAVVRSIVGLVYG